MAFLKEGLKPPFQRRLEMWSMNRNSSKGFTLVEVIVVSVIVAILAAVAIPIYIGYINDAAQNVANNEAANFSTAVSAGINSGATACAPNAAVPPKYTWTMPASFIGAAPTYQVGKGVTIALVAGTLIASPGTATITVRGKNATASW